MYQHLALKFHDLLPKSKPLDSWTTDMANQILTVLNHLRRIKNSEVRFAQAAHSLTEKDRAEL